MVGVTMNRQVRAETRSRSVSWPVRSGAVPPLAEVFISRPETGFDAARGLGRGATVVMTQPTVPDHTGRQPQAGLGGTGKTQLAVALASVLWRSREVDLLAWVPAASRDAVITGYAQALAAADGPGADADPDTAAASFLGWLATTSQPWLVVLDDLADAADLDRLWPRGAAGMVLVTTRLPASAVGGPGRRILEIGAFSPREALGYLSARLSEDAGQRAGALDLATDLGYLPLALAQAAAVIADRSTDCRSYRAQFADRTRQMPVDEAGPDAATVAATWSLSLDRADSLSSPGMAANALVLVALLDQAGIPGAVLTSPAACAYICGRHATGTPADQGQVRIVLDNLSRVGLVMIDPESAPRTVLMHGLVQAMIRRFIPPAMLEQAARAAADALLQAWPQADAGPLYEQALRECAASLHRAAPGPLWAAGAHPVFLRAGQSLSEAGLTGLAIPYWQNMISTSQVPGQAHAGMPLAHDHLAAAYLTAGRTADAIAAYEQSLADQQAAPAAGHPDTLATRSGLAQACLAAGRESDAIRLYETIVAEREQALGPEHPVTRSTRDDLVAAYLSAGRAPDAIGILQRVLNDRAAALGPDHPETLTAQAGLAAALLAGGTAEGRRPDVRAHPGRAGAGAGCDPSGHHDRARQPGLRLPLGRPAQARAARLRTHARRSGEGTRGRSSGYPDLAGQPGLGLPLRAQAQAGHPALRGGRRAAGAFQGPGSPRHADRARQPRLRLPLGRTARPGHHAAGADARGLRAAARPGPQEHADLACQPRLRLPHGGTARRGGSALRAHAGRL